MRCREMSAELMFGNGQSFTGGGEYDRRFTSASVEGGNAGLALGSRAGVAIAGTVHHREAGASDGRGRRRPCRDRAALLAGRPKRLWVGGGQALSRPFCGDGPYPARETGIGGAPAQMERAARDARRAAHTPPLPERAPGERCGGLVL